MPMKDNKLFGYAGKLLWVDLSSGGVRAEPLDPSLAQRFLGGRGIAAWFLWDLVPKGLDPFDERNPIIIMAGPLNGTPAPSAGRTAMACKSPLTGMYLKSSGGGHFSSALKLAGFDGIIVTGRADEPVYLAISPEKVEIRDARAIWGKKVSETIHAIRHDLQTEQVQVACIGPAGENGVLFAGVMLGPHNAVARGGIGALWGNKRLKAIAVYNYRAGTIQVAYPKEFLAIAMRARRVVAEDPIARSLYIWGTSGGVTPANETHQWPTRNFIEDYHEHADKVSGEHLKRGGYLRGRIGCASCTISCHRYSVVEQEGHSIGCGGPEFETFGALGAGLDISDIRYVILGSKLCNELGLDTISAGAVIQWAIESRERGVLSPEDCDGFKLEWGNGQEMLALLETIAYRKGNLGNLLAEGTKRAAEHVGGESWKWAVQANGLEQSRVETRVKKAYALTFAVNPRGPDHLTAEPMLPEFRTPAALELMEELCGPDECYRRDDTIEKRHIIACYHENIFAALDALGMCAFTATCAYTLRAHHLAALFSYATGIAFNGDEIMRAGARIFELERAFNVRDGRDRNKDLLPWRVMHEPVKTGPYKGLRNSSEELSKMLDEYYELRGWDKQGRPTRKSLSSLGLDEIADALEKMGLLGEEST